MSIVEQYKEKLEQIKESIHWLGQELMAVLSLYY